MNPQTAPTITRQIIVQQPVNFVFKTMSDQNLTAGFWLAEARGEVFEENRFSRWSWPKLEETVMLKVHKIIPMQLISLEEQDTFTRLDIELSPITTDSTLLELKVHNLPEQEPTVMELIKGIKSTLDIVEDGIKA